MSITSLHSVLQYLTIKAVWVEIWQIFFKWCLFILFFFYSFVLLVGMHTQERIFIHWRHNRSLLICNTAILRPSNTIPSVLLPKWISNRNRLLFSPCIICWLKPTKWSKLSNFKTTSNQFYFYCNSGIVFCDTIVPTSVILQQIYIPSNWHVLVCVFHHPSNLLCLSVLYASRVWPISQVSCNVPTNVSIGILV